MDIKDFPHVILMNNAAVKKKTLDGGIVHLISDFNRSYQGYILKPSEKTVVKLKEKSEVLAQVIYDYFVEEEEQVENPTLKEQIIAVGQAVVEDNQQATADELRQQAAELEALNNPVPAVVAGPVKIDTIPSGPAKEPAIPAEPVDPVKKEDTPPAENFKSENKDEEIIHKLFLEGKTSITKSELKSLGFNTSSAGRLGSMGANFRTYRLKGTKFLSTDYTIEKK